MGNLQRGRGGELGKDAGDWRRRSGVKLALKCQQRESLQPPSVTGPHLLLRVGAAEDERYTSRGAATLVEPVEATQDFHDGALAEDH